VRSDDRTVAAAKIGDAGERRIVKGRQLPLARKVRAIERSQLGLSPMSRKHRSAQLTQLAAKPCVGVRSSSYPNASVRIHNMPTGTAAAFMMRPTTLPSASTS